MMKTPVPVSLAAPGRKIWRHITAEYTLRPDELVTLEDVGAITDMIDALSTAWEEAGRPLTTTGSMGQLVIHPLIGEIRAQRGARNALWRQLRLPDLGDDGQRVRGVNPQREGGFTRWANQHGSPGWERGQ